MSTIIIDGKNYVKGTNVDTLHGLWYKGDWYQPEPAYKVDDWIIYKINDNSNVVEVRKVVNINKSNEVFDFDKKYGSWMTIEATQQFSNNVIRLAQPNEVKNHLVKMAKDKGLKAGIVIIPLLNSNILKTKELTSDSFSYFSVEDRLLLGNITVYMKGEWVEVVKEKVFTFGGQPVKFEYIGLHRNKYNFPVIEVTCKGETGTHNQIEAIINSYQSKQFGKVFHDKAINTNANVIKIGCLVGTFAELSNINEHCKNLLIADNYL